MTIKPKKKYIVVNNLRLHYLEWNSDSTRTMILLHGISGNAHVWDYFASNSSKDFRIIALDQRGHGASDWAIPPAYSCDDYISDLVEFVETLELDGVVFLGHSMGALHATMYASMRPDKVAGLIHVDIEPCPPPSNKAYLQGLYNTQPAFYNSIRDYANHVKKSTPYASHDILLNLASFALDKKEDGKYYIQFDKNVLKHFDQYDLRSNLAGIKCPTLIIRGRESLVMRREIAQKMNHTISKSEIVEISKAAHQVLTDNPLEFQQVVHDFLKSLGS